MTTIQTRCLALAAACALSATATPAAPPFQLQPGHIVTPQYDNSGTILAIDPTTGNRDILSLYPSIGAGPRMRRPASIVTLPDGNFLVAEQFTVHGVFRINRNTGDRTFISGEGSGFDGDPTTVGTGPIDHVGSVLLSPSGEIILVNDGGANYFSGFITKVDPATGNRTLISGLGAGSGPEFSFLRSGEFGLDGRIFVGGETNIFAVNVATGARSILSGTGVGTGPAFAGPTDLAVLPNGNLLVADFGSSGGLRSALFQVDITTGNRTIIDQHFFPSLDYNYQRIARDPTGAILGSTGDAYYYINPATGARTLVSGGGYGTGPNVSWGDMVVVVPEPTSAALLLTCAFLVVLKRRRSTDQ